MFTTADDFHHMLDHVSEGCSVLFANGEVLTVMPTMVGWCLVDWQGEQVSPSDLSAMGVSRFIFERNCG